VMKITNGRGVDVVLDCAGFSSTVKLGMQLVRPNGRVVIVGMGEDKLNDMPLGLLSTKEVEITSIFRYKNLYPTTISLIAGGLVDINGIVSKRFTFEQTAEAYASAYENPSETVKNIIIFE